MKQQIVIDNIQEQTVNGHIVLTECEPMIVEVGMRSYYEISGKHKTHNPDRTIQTIAKKRLHSSTHSFPFSIEVNVFESDTYHGANYNINYGIEALIKSSSSLIPICVQRQVNVTRTSNYKTKEEIHDIYYDSNLIYFFMSIFWLPLLVIICKTISYKIGNPMSDARLTLYFCVVPAVILLFITFLKYRVNKKVEQNVNLKAFVCPVEDGFNVRFYYNKTHFKLNTFQFKVIEYRYNSGKKNLFVSQVINNQDSYSFKYPKQANFKPFSQGDSEVYWKIHGVGKYKSIVDKKRKFSFKLSSISPSNSNTQITF